MSYITKLLWILILTIVSTIWISSQVGTVHAIPATTTPMVVKITSPHKGQQVGIGHNVTLLGSSNYNASSKCQVSIIVDNKRPYQNTIPIGQGVDNYSQWKYTLVPTYTALNEGINRVTAKLTCNASPVLTKSYSINLTGINQPPATSQPPQQQIAIKSNGTTSPLSLASALSNNTLAQSNSISNRTNTTSVLPVSGNGSSLIDPPSTQSSSSFSSGHGQIHHHSHHTHHSSSNSNSSGSSEHHQSSSRNSHTHSESENHNNGHGAHSSDSHHSSGGGHDFFHGAFSHFGG